jgi:hypothetical protein
VDTGSFARGGQPRSVPDADGDAYDEMLRQHGANARSNAAKPGATLQQRAEAVAGPRPHPPTEIDSVAAGIAQILNGPRAARRELERGHTGRAIVDGVTAAADLVWGGLTARGLIKGKLKLRPPFEWRTPPWTEGRGAREWMGDMGFAEKNQPMHHALIPQKGWGKFVPDAIKNQLANIKPSDNLTHTRIHSASRKFGLPRFNALERYLRGTPTWWKAANVSALGHTTKVAGDHLPPADSPASATPQTNPVKK